MANNANAQAILFCNQKVRPVADAVISALLSMQTLVTEWNAQDIEAIIPNDSNFVQDGATTADGSGEDGRPPITDGQVQVMISNCNTLIAQFTANTNLLENQFMQIMVNGRSVI